MLCILGPIHQEKPVMYGLVTKVEEDVLSAGLWLPHLCQVRHSMGRDYNYYNPASSLEKQQNLLLLLEVQPALTNVRNIINNFNKMIQTQINFVI